PNRREKHLALVAAAGKKDDLVGYRIAKFVGRASVPEKSGQRIAAVEIRRRLAAGDLRAETVKRNARVCSVQVVHRNAGRTEYVVGGVRNVVVTGISRANVADDGARVGAAFFGTVTRSTCDGAGR